MLPGTASRSLSLELICVLVACSVAVLSGAVAVIYCVVKRRLDESSSIEEQPKTKAVAMGEIVSDRGHRYRARAYEDETQSTEAKSNLPALGHKDRWQSRVTITYSDGDNATVPAPKQLIA